MGGVGEDVAVGLAAGGAHAVGVELLGWREGEVEVGGGAGEGADAAFPLDEEDLHLGGDVDDAPAGVVDLEAVVAGEADGEDARPALGDGETGEGLRRGFEVELDGLGDADGHVVHLPLEHGVGAGAVPLDVGDEVCGELGGDEVAGGVELEDGLVGLPGLTEDEEVGAPERLGELGAGLLERLDGLTAFAFEGAAGSVGEDVEVLGGELALFLGGAEGELEGAVEVGGGGGLLDAFDGGAGGLKVVGGLGRDGVGVNGVVLIDGAGGGDDHHLFVARGEAVDELAGHELGLAEMGLGVGASAGLVGHGVGVVDDEDVERGALTAQRRNAVVLASERTRQRQAHEEDEEAADGEEEPLLELEPAAVLPHRLEEVLHRGPLHDLEPSAVEDVDDDRDGGQRRARDGEAGADKPGGEDVGKGDRHVLSIPVVGRYLMLAARVARKPLRVTSRGSPVFMRW